MRMYGLLVAVAVAVAVGGASAANAAPSGAITDLRWLKDRSGVSAVFHAASDGAGTFEPVAFLAEPGRSCESMFGYVDGFGSALVWDGGEMPSPGSVASSPVQFVPDVYEDGTICLAVFATYLEQRETDVVAVPLTAVVARVKLPPRPPEPAPAWARKPGYHYCGWYDLTDSVWRWGYDVESGAFLTAWARGMTCHAARRNTRAVRWPSRPPYNRPPRRPGFRCQFLKRALEFQDVRCTATSGSPRAFRFQSGA